MVAVSPVIAPAPPVSWPAFWVTWGSLDFIRQSEINASELNVHRCVYAKAAFTKPLGALFRSSDLGFFFFVLFFCSSCDPDQIFFK